MRKSREKQSTIFDILPNNTLGHEYKTISKVLDQHPEILQWVASDLITENIQATGRRGLSAETILRAAIIKQHHQFSYQELSVHLSDSRTFRAFCRLGTAEPSKSTLQEGIARIKASTPRVSAPSLEFHNRTLACKRRLLALRFNARKAKKKKLYGEMIGYAQETMAFTRKAVETVSDWDMSWLGWRSEAERFLDLAEKVVSQSQRRVLQGESVPASEKIFSLFEDHTDIIVKGRQDITYGHKVSLTAGKSGMVLDLVVEKGNPCDVTRAVEMIERQIEIYGVAPKQCAFDGAYASKSNLKEIKALGVKDVMFQKKRGLKIEEMTKSPWVYRKLRNFRAGVESVISCLKRAFGLRRCTWKGWDPFQAYTWASAVSFNLATLGRKILEKNTILT